VGLSKICLDTSAYSHFMRGITGVVALVDAARWVGVAAVVLGELYAGFGLGARREANERTLAAFLRSPVVSVLDVDRDTAQIYAEMVIVLRRLGTPRPSNDIWVAVHASSAQRRSFSERARRGQVKVGQANGRGTREMAR
jgi:tRNA(fMet)-specific endonuclease VapC